MRRFPTGLLAFAASLSVLTLPVAGQFPIRQLPRTVGSQAAGPSPAVPANALPGQAQPPTAALQSQQPAAAPHPAVARVVVPEKDGVSYGSGTLIDARGQFGLVVTNWHVVRDAAGPVTVEFPDGFKSPAQVVKTDKDWDLAALSIYRPRATPLPVSSAAPQPGEWLTIAGYGGGDWRVAGGQCTQYLAPGIDFPHEMVELATEARQGDSGGPILNQRGELAGVLFGSGPGYTSGSYGGRVLKFLAAVVPGGTPGHDEPSPVGSPAPQASPFVNPGLAALESSQPTALHETKPPVETSPLGKMSQGDPLAVVDTATLTPASKLNPDRLLSPPPRSESSSRFGPASTLEGGDIDPRVAVTPDRFSTSNTALAATAIDLPAEAPALVPAAMSPRIGRESSGVDLNRAPPDQLLAAAWKQIGGKTIFDQAKTVLAGIGVLSLLIVFWRVGRQREPEREEE